MGKTFYIICRLRTNIGAELKTARLEAENKRSAFEILPKAKDPKGETGRSPRVNSRFYERRRPIGRKSK